MGLQLIDPVLNFSRRRKKWLLLVAALGFSGYGAYKTYHNPAVARKRKRLFNLVRSLISIAEAVSDSAETIGVVSNDLRQFLQSDSDKIPNSLKQISKIANSEEFSKSLVRVSEAVTTGVLRGCRNSDPVGDQDSGPSTSFSDRILDALSSTAGSGFASVVVGSFARNLVLAFYLENRSSGNLQANGSSNSPEGPTWVNVIGGSKSRELIADSIQLFVSTAVTVYLDKTMEINTYDEFFSGLTNPKHESKVKDVFVSLCNGAVETLVKTSHNVLTNSDTSTSGSPSLNLNSGRIEDLMQEEENPALLQRKRSSIDGVTENGWVDKVSSTLAVPSNRKLVLDVTGRVTFETVRSFLDFLVSKVSDGLKRSLDLMNREVIENGRQVVRYIGAKSRLIMTICLAFCLHVLTGARVLMPA